MKQKAIKTIKRNKAKNPPKTLSCLTTGKEPIIEIGRTVSSTISSVPTTPKTRCNFDKKPGMLICISVSSLENLICEVV